MMTPQQMEEISQTPHKIDQQILVFWRLVNSLLGWAWITGTVWWIVKIVEWLR